MFGDHAINAEIRDMQHTLTRIEGKINTMAQSQTQLDAAIVAVASAVNTLGTDLTNAIAALQAKITSGAGGASVDFTPEVNSLTAIASSLSAIDAKALAAAQGSSSSSSALTVNPASLSIPSVGATANFVATSTNASATFTAASSAPAVATVAPGSAPGSFVVTAVAAGTAAITVTDNATPPNHTVVNVSNVQASGASSSVTVNPASLAITGGVGSTGSLVATSTNASATFSAASSAPAVATVAPGNTAGSFVVTEVSAAGTAVITISDNATPANVATVNVTTT